MKNKEQEFIDWLCGKEGVRFPFFQEKDKPEIERPIKSEELDFHYGELLDSEYKNY